MNKLLRLKRLNEMLFIKYTVYKLHCYSTLYNVFTVYSKLHWNSILIFNSKPYFNLSIQIILFIHLISSLTSRRKILIYSITTMFQSRNFDISVRFYFIHCVVGPWELRFFGSGWQKTEKCIPNILSILIIRFF